MAKASVGPISVGKKVPDFSVTTTDGGGWKLKEVKGSKVVLFFYPKDMTSGCTVEAQQFRDHHAAFKRANTLVIGVSRDSCRSHQRFKDKESLNYELLSDEDEALCKLFDVIREKNMYGKKVVGIERSTFLINDQGKLFQDWRKVKVKGHVDEVLEAVKAL